VGEMGEGGQKVETSSYKISQSGDIMYSKVVICHDTVCLRDAKRVALQSSYHKKKLRVVMYLVRLIVVIISQYIHILNLCYTFETNVICQLHLNKKKTNESYGWLCPFLVRADIP